MKKKGQVWVETVIYTLIGLTLIGLILAFATPAIQKQKDRITIERTTEAMITLQNNIATVKLNGPSDSKESALTISRGKLTINSNNEKITFQIEDSSYAPSEPGINTELPGTDLLMLTEKKGKKFQTKIILDYTEKLNITYMGKDTEKVITPAAAPYLLICENLGKTGSLTQINFYMS
ncbi:MAG: hypothetical protein WC796_05510 [Candidatus Pacearchaeota archaeon]